MKDDINLPFYYVFQTQTISNIPVRRSTIPPTAPVPPSPAACPRTAPGGHPACSAAAPCPS